MGYVRVSFDGWMCVCVCVLVCMYGWMEGRVDGSMDQLDSIKGSFCNYINLIFFKQYRLLL